MIFLCHLEIRLLHLPYSSKRLGTCGAAPYPRGSPAPGTGASGVLGRDTAFALLVEELHFSPCISYFGKNPAIRCDSLLSSAHTSRVTAATNTTSAATDAFATAVTEAFVTSRLACLSSQRLPSLVLISQLLIRKIPHLLCLVSPAEVFKLLGDAGTEATDRQREMREKAAAAPAMMPRCHQTPHRTVRSDSSHRGPRPGQ